MPSLFTVGTTPTSCGAVRTGNYVFNTGSDIVYLGSDPNSASVGGGVVLYPATAVQWEKDGYLYAACPAGSNPQIYIYRDGDGTPGVIPFSAGEQIIPTGLHSAGYQAGVSGWRIGKDGSAEFNSGTFRGTVTAGQFVGANFIVNTDGIFFYSGTPALGNLVAWWTQNSSGIDQFGNAYTGPALEVGPNTGNFAKLATKAGLSGLFLNPNPATLTDADLLTTYSSLSGISGMQLDAPFTTVGGVQASLFLQSGNASNAPVLYSSTQTSVASNNFLYASGNLDNTQTNNIGLGAAPSGDIGITSVTFNAEANRRYRISACWDSINTGGVASNHYVFRIKKGAGGATTVKSIRGEASGVSQTDLGGSMWALDTPYTGPNATGSVTYFFTANHDAGADNSSLTAPATLTVEGWQ